MAKQSRVINGVKDDETAPSGPALQPAPDTSMGGSFRTGNIESLFFAEFAKTLFEIPHPLALDEEPPAGIVIGEGVRVGDGQGRFSFAAQAVEHGDQGFFRAAETGAEMV
ncbi:MAG: hypothetical protein LUG19_12155, partial [Desulfovibrio sp.]|uniref:hypothetical protein n=1 Tax=Desulfovibrio sp. TaxID=885 RepID=UPI00258E456B